MREGLFIVLAFFGGVLLAFFHLLPESFYSFDFTSLSNYLLYLLLFIVGLSIGVESSLSQLIREMKRRHLFMPLITIMGTLIGSVIAFCIIRLIGIGPSGEFSLLNAITINSALGYYSLGSIMISQEWGVRLGAVALLANLFREQFTILCAPLINRHIGRYALIASGGITASDVTLPIILRYGGNGIFPVAMYNAIVCNIFVPLLLALLTSL